MTFSRTSMDSAWMSISHFPTSRPAWGGSSSSCHPLFPTDTSGSPLCSGLHHLPATMRLPGATRSGLIRLSTVRTPVAETSAPRVGPRELKFVTTSSLRPVVPLMLSAPTVITLGSWPGELMLPSDLQEGDYILFHGMGAYSTVTNTRFNGFGELTIATVMTLR